MVMGAFLLPKVFTGAAEAAASGVAAVFLAATLELVLVVVAAFVCAKAWLEPIVAATADKISHAPQRKTFLAAKLEIVSEFNPASQLLDAEKDSTLYLDFRCLDWADESIHLRICGAITLWHCWFDERSKVLVFRATGRVLGAPERAHPAPSLSVQISFHRPLHTTK
jgi:hypothetical protein